MEKVTGERAKLWDHAIRLSNKLTLVHAVEETLLGTQGAEEGLGRKETPWKFYREKVLA